MWVLGLPYASLTRKQGTATVTETVYFTRKQRLGVILKLHRLEKHFPHLLFDFFYFHNNTSKINDSRVSIIHG